MAKFAACIITKYKYLFSLSQRNATFHLLFYWEEGFGRFVEASAYEFVFVTKAVLSSFLNDFF